MNVPLMGNVGHQNATREMPTVVVKSGLAGGLVGLSMVVLFAACVVFAVLWHVERERVDSMRTDPEDQVAQLTQRVGQLEGFRAEAAKRFTDLQQSRVQQDIRTCNALFRALQLSQSKINACNQFLDKMEKLYAGRSSADWPADERIRYLQCDKLRCEDSRAHNEDLLDELLEVRQRLVDAGVPPGKLPPELPYLPTTQRDAVLFP